MENKSPKAAVVSLVLFFPMLLFASNGDMGASTQPLTDGSQEYPYLIEDFQDFQKFANPNFAVRYWEPDIYIRLECDLNLDPALTDRQTYTTAVIAPDLPDTTWAFNGMPFQAVFDGNNHTITNLKIEPVEAGKKYLALFGKIDGPHAVVKNLTLQNVTVNTEDNSDYTAALAAENSGTITNCHVEGVMNAGVCLYVSGVCAVNDGDISHCGFEGTIVTQAYCVGGVCGVNKPSASIAHCHSIATIQGHNSVGGLVGQHYMATIQTSFSEGTVTGNDDVGGLVGLNYDGSIETSYAAAQVVGNEYVGGLAGRNGEQYSHDGSGSIVNCYANGDVEGNRYVGGLTAESYDGVIIQSYASGKVTGGMYVGGIVAASYGSIHDSFWDINTTQQRYSAGGGIGLTTVQMKDIHYYIASNWGSDIWTIDAGNDYPRLKWENKNGQEINDPIVTMPGSGTSEDPWHIRNLQDFLFVTRGSFFWDKHLILDSDIDLQGRTFNRGLMGVGYADPFTGCFDGNGHVIRNVTIDGGSYLGLFGYVGGDTNRAPYKAVKSLGVEQITVNGLSYVGGLIGSMGDPAGIEKCYAKGQISGSNNAGGLVGENYTYSSYYYYYGIADCFADCTVNGNWYVGGLTGINYGHIIGCYAKGSATGIRYVGGFVGKNFYYQYGAAAFIDECYSNAAVAGEMYVGGFAGYNEPDWIGIGRSFWNTETSGASGSVGNNLQRTYGVAGKTDAEMRTMATYLAQGWNFVEVPEDGVKPRWRMADYPALWWEFSRADFGNTKGVNLLDFQILAGTWSLSAIDPHYNDTCDLVDDDVIDINDVIAFSSHWLEE